MSLWRLRSVICKHLLGLISKPNLILRTRCRLMQEKYITSDWVLRVTDSPFAVCIRSITDKYCFEYIDSAWWSGCNPLNSRRLEKLAVRAIGFELFAQMHRCTLPYATMCWLPDMAKELAKDQQWAILADVLDDANEPELAEHLRGQNYHDEQHCWVVRSVMGRLSTES